MAVPPSLPTTWSDTSSRVSNLAGSINDLATAVNTMLPLGTSWVAWTPTLVATTTDPTLGTGSVSSGRYFQVGKLVVASFKIQFGTSGVNAGSGLYRINLPTAVNATARSNDYVVGTGHIHDYSVGYLGLGPGAYRTVTFHTNTAITNLQAGIVVGSLPHAALGTYTVTNPTTDRALNVTADTLAQGLAVVGTLAADLNGMFPEPATTTDNTAADSPFVWAASDQIIGTLIYEAA